MKHALFAVITTLIALNVVGCNQETLPSPSPTATQPSTASPVFIPSATASPFTTPTLAPSPTETSLAYQTLPPPSQETACLTNKGTVEISQLEVKELGKTIDYRVYLPPCYRESSSQSYPVLYLIHGQSFNDDQWDRLGVDETLDRLIAAHELPPFLVVMPRDEMWGSAEEDPFDELLLQGLLPFIDSHYRTLADRRYRAIGGLSRGAGWAAHLGLSNWELFGAIGMHSLALFWSDIPHVKKWLDEIPPEAMPRLYLDAGQNDRPEILQSAAWFEELLTQRNIAHEWYLFAGYHNEEYWSAHLEGYLRWYGAEWYSEGDAIPAR